MTVAVTLCPPDEVPKTPKVVSPVPWLSTRLPPWIDPRERPADKGYRHIRPRFSSAVNQAA